MRLYLVRHGNTPQNDANTYQAWDIPLSIEGVAQAKAVAERVANLPLEHIYSSDYPRAQETATLIGRRTGIPVEIEILLREMSRPSELHGLARTDPQAKEIMAAIQDHIDDRHWHYSDEENFFDIQCRVEKFLEYLSVLSSETVLIVTHALFLKHLLANLFFEEDLTPQLFNRLYRFFRKDNTGITILDNESGRWRLYTWNDHAHLSVGSE